MIDPFARSLLESAQSPLASDETSSYVGISYLKKIAKLYFDTTDDIDVSSLSEELSKLSLAASILINTNADEKDISTAFLIAESAEVAFDGITSSEDIDVSLILPPILHLLDMASFFHLADFDANANILAEKALNVLDNPIFDDQNQVSLALISYYRSLGFYLSGKFGHLINEDHKKIVALSTQDFVFIRLVEILAELTNVYRGLDKLSDKSINELNAMLDVLTSSGLYTILNSEITRLQNFANVAERKALYPLLTEKLHGQKSYLDARISGVSDGAYPFAWPPVRKFCEEYLGGKYHHAIVALPTGSGKSFLAELAIVSFIQQGWILYLAPTNALCAQIKNDLNKNLVSVENSQIDLFLGGIEYAPDIEGLKPINNHIAVMTPEKASLFLKLYPEKAENCSMLILDECHMLGESNRGIIAEFVLSSMLNASPDIHIILMSALLGNSKELGDWLEEKTGKSVDLLQGDWRPTRSSRIALIQDSQNKQRIEIKKKITYRLPIVAVSDAYTPWTEDNEHYLSWPTNLFITSDDPTYFKPDKNNLAKDLAVSLATKKIQTLIIVFSSKHNIFSIAGKVINLPENIISQSQNEFDWLKIANYELGVESQIGLLIANNQVSVHSTLMLQAERKASEDAFNRGRTKVMVSTTTLAQGLNLNTQVVILAGTEFFIDPKEDDYEDIIDIKTRALQQVLNGCGRAARANMTTRGFSVIIPNSAIHLPEKNVKTTIIKSLPLLSSKENVFTVSSKIYDLLEQVQVGNHSAEPNASESQLIVLLPTDSEKIIDFLNKTLASDNMSEGKLKAIADRINYLISSFAANDIPNWLLRASHLSNMNLELIIELKNYIQHLDRNISIENYKDLANFFMTWLEQLSPNLTWEFLSSHIKRWRWYWGKDQDPDIIKQIESGQIKLENSDKLLSPLWQNLRECVNLWLEDGTYLDIGNNLIRGRCESEKFSFRSSPGRPIPRSIIWVQKTMDKLSIFAGGLSALRDVWQENDEGSLPKWLADSKLVQSLPMAIRFGVSNPTSLIWYRSVIGERRIANLLSQLIPFTVENPFDNDEIRGFLNNAKKYLNENEELIKKNELIPVIRRLSNR